MNMTAEGYRSLLAGIGDSSETTYVIGHKNPDSDSVGSAMAFAYLLRALGMEAEAAVCGAVNNETRYVLDLFGLQAPDILENAEGRRIALVDHSSYAQAVPGAEKATITAVLDHHGMGDIADGSLFWIRCAPVGATASLVFLTYMECVVAIPADMARVMLMGILSDTRGMARNVSTLDRVAYDALVEIAQIPGLDTLYGSMAGALASYGEMDDLAIFMSDYKEYSAGGKRFGVAVANAMGEEEVRRMAQRMEALMEEVLAERDIDMLFVIVNNKGSDESENMMYMMAFGDGAEELLEMLYHNGDGDHFYVFKENLSRKTSVVPAIIEGMCQGDVSADTF
ncbi:MAG: DHH family phosphoesterase [Lachnospiraceae bacterium]|nr:DHH family phosphoesterase [Lachnospiraceae bacterium]